MSILNRFTSRHLDDAALAELWMAGDGSRDVVTHPHLERCAECRVRLTTFGSWMEDVRTDAISEADAAFSGERLAAQQAQIFKRLEAAERPARVIVFPKFPASASGRPSPATRWVATAAAAGLIIGIGLGNMMDLRHFAENRDARPIARPAVESAGRGVAPASGPVGEDATFQDLEAIAAPQYEALRAFDTFTPRAADFMTSSR